MATQYRHSALNAAYEAAMRGPETCPRCDGYIVVSSEFGEKYLCLICGHRVYESKGVQLGLDLSIYPPAAIPRNISPERRKKLIDEFRIPDPNR